MDTARFKTIAEAASLAIDAVGALVIVAGLAWALVRWVDARRARRAGGVEDPYRRLRRDIGRGILLGLEFMVAGDIIRTVAVEPTLDSVVVLGAIVLIRTFLSFSLEVELEGRWPWRQPRDEPAARG
jgi:uncharacterized membrane protein